MYFTQTAGSCPLTALSSLTTRIQKLSTDIVSTKEQIGLMQEQLAELRRFGAPRMAGTPSVPTRIGTRRWVTHATVDRYTYLSQSTFSFECQRWLWTTAVGCCSSIECREHGKPLGRKGIDHATQLPKATTRFGAYPTGLGHWTVFRFLWSKDTRWWLDCGRQSLRW